MSEPSPQPRRSIAPDHGWLRATLVAVILHPAAWLFAAVWVLSALRLVLVGHAGHLSGAFINLIMILLFSLVTVRLTLNAGPAESTGTIPRSRLWLQAGVVFLFILLTGVDGLVFHKVAPPWLQQIPVWTRLIEALRPLAEAVGPNPNWWLNPVKYTLLPLAVLLLLGARPRHLGLGPGVRTWAVAALWVAPLAILTGVGALFGQFPGFGRLAMGVLSHGMQNGFFEEFLFRGALQPGSHSCWMGAGVWF